MAQPSESCLLKAAKVYGEHFSGKELVELFNRAAEIKQKQIDMGFTDDIDARVADAIRKETQREKQSALAKKIRTQQNAITLADNINIVTDFVRQGMTVKNAVLALFHGTIKAVTNGRISIMRQKLAFESKLKGEVMGRIAAEKPHLFELLRSEQFDEAVTRELQELGPGGKPGSTGNTDAKWMAALLNKQLKISRIILNKWGANLEQSVGYIGPEAHNDMKINKNFENWAKDLMGGMLNLEATFPGLNPKKQMKEISALLEKAYHQIITGENSAFGTTLGSRTAEAPITTQFVFNDANASIQYQKKWGYSSTISSVLNMLDSRAHDAALMERFGSNVDAGMTKLLTHLRESIKEGGGDRSELAGLTLDSFRPAINIATGQVNHIQNHKIASVFADVRATSMMALLGKALIASMPADTMSIALAGMFRGDGFLRSLGGALFKTMDGLSPEDRKMAAYYYGEGFDGLLGKMHRASLAEDGRIGGLSKHTTTYFYLNGLTPWTDSRRGMAARMIGAQMGRESDKTFAQLNWRYRNVLEQNGIGDKDWEQLRKLVQTGPNGNKYIFPEGFEKLEGMTKYEKEQLELNLRGYIADEVNMGMMEGDAASQYHSLARLGAQRGTFMGEMIRSATMFTSFPTQFMIRVLGRSIQGVPGKNASERFMRSVPHAGAMMASMLAAYYMSWTMKELAKGNTPPIPTQDNLKEFMPKLLIESGVAGYYGSLVLDAMFNNRMPSPGPVAETGKNIAYAAGQLLVGDYEKAGVVAYDTILQNTPGANLFYLRPVLDSLFLNSIDEVMHPRRAGNAEKTRETFGQERIW